MSERHYGFLALLAAFALCALDGRPCEAANWEDRNARFIRAGKFRVTQVQRRVDQMKGAILGELHMTRFEVEVSSSGLRASVPMQFDYGVPGRWEFLAEPVIAMAANPTTGRWVRGSGKFRLLFACRVLGEQRYTPSLSFATRGAVSTGEDFPFSAGRSDYSGELIAFKQFGNLGIRARAGHRLKSQLPGGRFEVVRNRVNYRIAAEYRRLDRYELLGELSGSTSLLERSSRRRSSPELSGTIGGGIFVHPTSFVHLSVSYRSDHTVSLRPGATLKF